MVNRQQIRAKTSTGAPVAGDMLTRELVWNDVDNKLYIKKANGTIQEITNSSISAIDVQVDFGAKPINEKTTTVTDANCTTDSNIQLIQVFKSQTEENFGVLLNSFTECFNGSFNIISISTEPFSRGIFNLKYTIL